VTTVYEPITPTQYLVRERAAASKSEYYAGAVVAMAGASRTHVRIVTSLARHLGNRLAGGPCEPFVAAMRVGITGAGAYVYPDVAVVGGEPRFEDPALDTLVNPTVLIEVLSSSTERLDRGRKAQAYRALPTLREYVLVAQDRPRVEVYGRGDDGTWEREVRQGLADVLPLRSLGLEVPLAAVYERVFPAADAS
jgi:Uma2 family endonuclease